jgi:nucleoside-diphosphate-sugar epimerase
LLHAGALACDIVGRIVGRPMPLNSWRYAELASEGFVCCVDRMRDLLGVTAKIDIADGLAQTAAWYRDAGWLRR